MIGMTLWLASLLLVAGGAAYFILTRFRKFYIVQKIAGDRKWLSWVIACIPIVIAIIFGLFFMIPTVIIVIHAFIFWILFSIGGTILGKITKKHPKYYISGALAICFTAIYFVYAFFAMTTVFQTNYEFTSNKTQGEKLRIAMIADSHMGTAFSGKGFIKHLERMKKTNPDVFVIVGDYVDDDTKKVDMLKATQAMRDWKPKYGKYFIWGNHDDPYFRYRDFSTNELKQELKKAGFVILDDKNVYIGKNKQFCLLGRNDRTDKGRMTPAQLAKGVDRSKYLIMLDHQPNDYANQKGIGLDMVLSGHTHGGQMIPITFTGQLTSTVDQEYGQENIDGTNFIVTSGIAGWGCPFKTGCISEYVIIDIK